MPQAREIKWNPLGFYWEKWIYQGYGSAFISSILPKGTLVSLTFCLGVRELLFELQSGADVPGKQSDKPTCGLRSYIHSQKAMSSGCSAQF